LKKEIPQAAKPAPTSPVLRPRVAASTVAQKWPISKCETNLWTKQCKPWSEHLRNGHPESCGKIGLDWSSATGGCHSGTIPEAIFYSLIDEFNKLYRHN
jgi:hypothetical protein